MVKELWQKVILRNKLYLQILNNLIQDTFDDALPPLWLIDSVVNSKSSGHHLYMDLILNKYNIYLYFRFHWIPSIILREIDLVNLFYAYHWQCQKIGKTLFNSLELSEIVNKIRQLNISQTNPPLLYQRLSIYFNASIENLRP